MPTYRSSFDESGQPRFLVNVPDAPKAPQTAEEARALADRLDADAEKQEETAAKTRRSAAAWRAYARALEEGPAETSSLTSTRVDSTLDIDTMEARTRSDSAKFKTGSQNAGKARDATPFGRWLSEKQMAASVWAAQHADEKGRPRWSPMAVRAWMLPRNADAARAIPEDAAKLIAKETKGAVPAVDASWPSGISRQRRRLS